MKKLFLTLLISGVFATASANTIFVAAAANIRGDYAAELEIIRPLAASGVAWAQLFLGLSFAHGDGVIQDFSKAAKWFRLAAEQGDAIAQLSLGEMFDNGQGVSQNYVEAVKWYRLAAAQGNAMAQHNLGSMHYSGQGVVQDYKKAHMWFNLAAVKGRSNSVNARDAVAQRMTTQQIGEAQAMARQCMERKFKGCD